LTQGALRRRKEPQSH